MWPYCLLVKIKSTGVLILVISMYENPSLSSKYIRHWICASVSAQDLISIIDQQ